MKYFGVPRCPYCKKRVNFIRTWSLKRQGEYQCPRCGGISNIYLSPLIYVFALLAVFSSGALYFFHKFVLDDVDLSTIWQVAVPFLCFFLLSLFMVYLEKPVIKKVSRAEQGKKRGGRAVEDRKEGGYAAPRNTDNRMFYDEDEYLPQGDYRTGPVPQEMLPKPAPQNDLSKTSVVDVSHPLRAAKAEPVSEKLGAVKTEPARPQPRQQAVKQRPAKQAAASQPSQSFSQVPEPVRQTASVRQTAPRKPAVPVRETQPAAAPVSQVRKSVSQTSAASIPAAQSTARHVVTQVEIPSVTAGGTDDFLAKYDDPEYVERRLRELRGKDGKQ